jgi:hypothetical protein
MMREWQNISSAPMDGTEFEASPGTRKLEKYKKGQIVKRLGDLWYQKVGGEWHLAFFKPKYWRPL